MLETEMGQNEMLHQHCKNGLVETLLQVLIILFIIVGTSSIDFFGCVF